MQIREAIILAGGLGTRLRSVVADLPKCMAPVNGMPFIAFVIEELQNKGIDKFIFSLGYKHEFLTRFINTQYPKLTIQYCIEEEPLGTGGAFRLACGLATEKTVLAANGDTLFRIDTAALAAFHNSTEADCSLSLKPMKDFDRYGVVELNEYGAVVSFKEKQWYQSGCINGGVYALNTEKFMREDLGEKFSFEKDYLEKMIGKRKMYGLVQDEYFIDIGIPEDYEKAKREL